MYQYLALWYFYREIVTNNFTHFSQKYSLRNLKSQAVQCNAPAHQPGQHCSMTMEWKASLSSMIFEWIKIFGRPFLDVYITISFSVWYVQKAEASILFLVHLSLRAFMSKTLLDSPRTHQNNSLRLINKKSSFVCLEYIWKKSSQFGKRITIQLILFW